MYLKHKNGSMVEVLAVSDLFDPNRKVVSGRFHAGEELQEPMTFIKHELVFPSGETLPRCWLDPAYKHKLSN
jgi:hypothetical protein